MSKRTESLGHPPPVDQGASPKHLAVLRRVAERSSLKQNCFYEEVEEISIMLEEEEEEEEDTTHHPVFKPLLSS